MGYDVLQTGSQVGGGGGGATCPALHFVAALQLPTFPGLSVYPTPALHGAHFVTGSESWSVVPAAQSLQTVSFVGPARIQGS